MVKACLTGKDYMIWNTQVSEQTQVTAVSNLAQVVLISDDMFVSQGPYRVNLNIEVAAYAQINTANKKVCNKLQLQESR